MADMPRNYSDGDRIPKASAAARVFHGERRSLRERFGGLRNIPLFLICRAANGRRSCRKGGPPC